MRTGFILTLNGSTAVKPKPILGFQKLFHALAHLLVTNHIHSLNENEHFLKVLKENFKLMLKQKKSKFQNASTLQ